MIIQTLNIIWVLLVLILEIGSWRFLEKIEKLHNFRSRGQIMTLRGVYYLRDNKRDLDSRNVKCHL